MKYQFSIRVKKKGDLNSAASKAVLDCNKIFTQKGYKDYNLVFDENQSKAKYYSSIIKALVTFFFTIKKDSVVGIQYPMLNNIFKHFIKAARLKNIRFFAIIHDIESLRLGGKDEQQNREEAANLDYYDYLVVHNNSMMKWLRDKGVSTRLISLELFDYIMASSLFVEQKTVTKTIAFAGNLTKSAFVYQLNELSNWSFNLYGPNFKRESIKGNNSNWAGEFSPEQVVEELRGDFGLIWDGQSIDRCDDILGNYLRYNNPHKFSLYLAAGLPVIAPHDSAIGKLIKEKNIGVLVTSLRDINDLQIDDQKYSEMKANSIKLSNDVRRGKFFTAALNKVESALGVN